MHHVPDNSGRFEIVLYDDPHTPFSFVVDLLRGVFAIPAHEAERIGHRIHQAGKWSLGPFPLPVAQVFYDECRRVIAANAQMLLVEIHDHAKLNGDGSLRCAFCGKARPAVETLLYGKRASICDECIVGSARQLYDQLPTAQARFTYQLLDWHFAGAAPDSIVKTSRRYPGRVRADLQTAIDELFTARAVRTLGIKQQYAHEHIDLTSLWTKGTHAHGIAPLSFEAVDIGETEPKQCQVNGLWLLAEGDQRYAAVLTREDEYTGGSKVFVEISGPQGEQTAAICRRSFDAIEQRVREAKSYRGKVLSLEQSPHYGGCSTGITVHRIGSVQRSQVILPEATLKELDRSIVRFCGQREKLRDLGLATKRGVLFYGPPGTGKTHTIRYLASQLPGHTTLLVTAEQIALLPEYFALARLLQPVIFVIEDADLLAKSRELMHGPAGEILLNHLLNEMDGLKEDADILFVLSTNKPEVLEEALIARPGRIDQLTEFPKPDGDCRRRLMSLYGGRLSLADAAARDLVARTEGVSAAFIKELMRRLAHYALERGAGGHIEDTDVDLALNEMLFQNNVLSQALLGTSGET